ncbi:MAG: response regulator [Oscillospiraceae bacterium]|nr:response regulator [Oscillospiraceae bacterium]
MKKIALIGKMNEWMESINELLHRYFRVQLCTENPKSALAAVRVVKPDLIVLSLAGFYEADRMLFEAIRRDFPEIPVLSIGTDAEWSPFSSYYADRQFENLTRPVEKATVLSTICRRLNISEQAMLSEAAQQEDTRKKVLVVDDNASTLRSIKGMLEKNYNVMLANSGMKALTSIGKCRPDVILLDYEMPVCDGRQTLEMIRSDEELTTIPVIFLTSVNDKEHIQAVIKLLPAGYMLKPPVPSKLIEAIEGAIAGSAAT